MPVWGAAVLFLIFAVFFVLSLVFLKGALRITIAITDGIIMLVAAGYILCAYILVSAVEFVPMTTLPMM